MKVTRKPPDLNKIFKDEDAETKGGEVAPSLFLQGLSKAIQGLDKGDFQAHVKGKCRSHTCRNKDGKETHDYDLDVHDFEPVSNGSNGGKKKKTGREEVEDAMDKYDKDKQSEKKAEKK